MTENAPDFIVYTVKAGGAKSDWTKIGAGWSHSDGSGLNVTLNALPPPDNRTGRLKLVLRAADKPSTPCGGEAPARVPTTHLQASGGDCPKCQGKHKIDHPTRGPIWCPVCHPKSPES